MGLRSLDFSVLRSHLCLLLCHHLLQQLCVYNLMPVFDHILVGRSSPLFDTEKVSTGIDKKKGRRRGGRKGWRITDT